MWLPLWFTYSFWYAENGCLAQTLKAFGKFNERLVANFVVKGYATWGCLMFVLRVLLHGLVIDFVSRLYIAT